MTITLITVVLNCVDTISDTINSVLSQTYKDIEYILIDGGSTDGTLDIIYEYESKFNGKMHVFSEPDTGVYNAINKGITLAKGDVIGLLHADDLFSCDSILERVARGLTDKWV
ncbi:MAG: glycosyltransferase, partial [Muribaculaceae bacterium]